MDTSTAWCARPGRHATPPATRSPARPSSTSSTTPGSRRAAATASRGASALVEDRAVRQRMAELMQPVWDGYVARLQLGITPYNVVDDTEPETVAHAAYALIDGIATVPVVLAVAADLRRIALMDSAVGRVPMTGGASIYPFCWSILLAARARGLGGVLTTFLSRAEPAAAPGARPARRPRARCDDLPRRPAPAGHEAAPGAGRLVRDARPLRRSPASHAPDRASARGGRTCARRRRTAAGCSNAAKWPPLSCSLHSRMSVKRRSAQRRDGAKISAGKIDIPDGTSIGVAPPERVEALPVEATRRRAGAGQPVVHDVVEEPVARHGVLGMAVVVGPRPELLDDPRRLRGRRVDEAVAERLRAGRLLRRVAHPPLAVLLEPGERRLLGLGQLARVLARARPTPC